jgi:naphthalene 1,2-dioxygenase system ferredoxin subunit
MSNHVVASIADLAPGTMRHAVVDGRELCIYNVDGTFYATDDRCTHRRARLSDGFLEGRTVQCPLHFGKFDVITGHPANKPCTIPVAVYSVTRDGDNLLVDVPAADAGT